MNFFFVPITSAREAWGGPDKEKVWEKAQDSAILHSTAVRLPSIQPQRPQPIRFSKLRWRSFLTGMSLHTSSMCV